MTRYRLAALSIAAVAALIAWRLDWLPVWLRAFSATHAMVCVAVAVFARAAVEVDDTDDQWQPAPPDPTVLAGHRDALNPVPAVARPPVDALLAEVIPPRPTPMHVTEDGEIVPTVDRAPDDRILAVERAVVTVADQLEQYGDRMDGTLNRFADLVAGKVDELDRRLVALEAHR